MPKIKAIIFDLNGIFLKCEPLSQRVQDKFGIDKDLFWDKVKEIIEVSKTTKNVSPEIWQPVVNLLNISLTHFFEFWFSGEKTDLEMFEYARELKDKGYKVFILSNSLSERTEYYRQNFPQLLADFDGIYFSCETGLIKPNPKAFENILETNHLEPSECLFFDDSPKNVQVAINFGIKSRVFDGLNATKKFIEENSY